MIYYPSSGDTSTINYSATESTPIEQSAQLLAKPELQNYMMLQEEIAELLNLHGVDAGLGRRELWLVSTNLSGELVSLKLMSIPDQRQEEISAFYVTIYPTYPNGLRATMPSHNIQFKATVNHLISFADHEIERVHKIEHTISLDEILYMLEQGQVVEREVDKYQHVPGNLLEA